MPIEPKKAIRLIRDVIEVEFKIAESNHIPTAHTVVRTLLGREEAVTGALFEALTGVVPTREQTKLITDP